MELTFIDRFYGGALRVSPCKALIKVKEGLTRPLMKND
jgi:hypothetical protein